MKSSDKLKIGSTIWSMLLLIIVIKLFLRAIISKNVAIDTAFNFFYNTFLVFVILMITMAYIERINKIIKAEEDKEKRGDDLAHD